MACSKFLKIFRSREIFSFKSLNLKKSPTIKFLKKIQIQFDLQIE